MEILLYEEFKDSNDYLMQKWFIEQKKQIMQWFMNPSMDGFNFDSFDWSSNDSYSMYSANLKFNNDKIEYIIDFEIDADKVENGEVPEWKFLVRSYDVITADLLAQLEKTIQISEWNMDALLQIISELDNNATPTE